MIHRNVFTGELEVDKKERLQVGKHKGSFINNYMVIDPWYLVWLVKTYKENHKYNPMSDTWVAYIEEYAATHKQPNYAGDYKTPKYG